MSSLLELNTRVTLRARSDALGRPATLDDIPDAQLDAFAASGFDWLYALGVWRTGEAGRHLSRTRPEWLAGFRAALPDLDERDIPGSCFAITGTAAAPAMGGDPALRRFRDRLHARGLRLMLDFVPNHVAPDHPWAASRPDLFVAGTPERLRQQPDLYLRVGPNILAHGRDPNFPAWPDTLQLDYANPATISAMRAELAAAAGFCDGLRCDMAMLLLPEVFERTWGQPALPFWPDAIGAIRAERPGFLFLAEVYWGLDSRLREQGFDVTYDKGFYDALRAADVAALRTRLQAPAGAQRRMARFLENHDEPRAAAVFPPDRHRAAAVLAFATPAFRFFHDGQLEGRRAHVPVHLDRAPPEPPGPGLSAFYARLLAALRDHAFRDGAWTLLDPAPAWDGNWTHAGFLAFTWEGRDSSWLGVVNMQGNQAQCWVQLRLPALAGRTVILEDVLGPFRYERDGDTLLGRGMYFDLPSWGCHLFRIAAR